MMTENFNSILDHAKRLAEKGKGTYTMKDWATRLKVFLNFNVYPVLTNAGKVRADIAKRFAETEFSKFRIIQDREYKSDFNKLIDASHNGLPQEPNISDRKDLSPFDNSLKRALDDTSHDKNNE